jgi:hypothetical protein
MYGQMHCRVMLQKQLELHALEQELKELDAKDIQDENMEWRLRMGEYREGICDPTQKNLIDKIASKLAEYGKYNQRHAKTLQP